MSTWFMMSCRCSSCCYLFVSTWICVESLYGESHKSPQPAYDCGSFSDFFFFFPQSGPNSREPGKNHLILFALNWNSESTISCSHFPKVIANWCELLNSLHLIAAEAAQDDFTLNSSLIFGMCKSPWLFLVISWLRLFLRWCTRSPCMIAPLDSGTIELQCCCCCCDESCRLFVFLLTMNVFLKCRSLSPLSSTYWCYQAQ